MRIAGWLGLMGLGSVLACTDVPPQIEMPTAGDGATSSTTTGDPSTTWAASNGTGSVADGSGSGSATEASQSETTDPDGGTTEGVQPGTSTGDRDDGRGSTSTGDGDERGESSSGAPSPSCLDRYGDAPDYILCMETETECHFSTRVDGAPCNDICTTYGGTCIAAYDNAGSPNDCMILNMNDSCEDSNGHTTELCVCSK